MEDMATKGLTPEEVEPIIQAITLLPAHLSSSLHAAVWKGNSGRVRRIEWQIKDVDKISEIINRLQVNFSSTTIKRHGIFEPVNIRWQGNANPQIARMGTMLRNAESRVAQALGETYKVEQIWKNKCLTVRNAGGTCRQIYWAYENLQEKWGTAGLKELGVPPDTIKSISE